MVGGSNKGTQAYRNITKRPLGLRGVYHLEKKKRGSRKRISMEGGTNS